ncbi:MAG: hypothetical protein OXU23_26245 [Candidatus Poribacteria bacterium]|nr:hypothetical protein [Candidatus Poribacteria bacterium]MDE0465803.1 hypothetical protein [Candidatus Poribacteria bacterium]
MKKPPSNSYQMGSEDFDTRFDMDMLNIEAFEENLEREKLKAEVDSETKTAVRNYAISPELVNSLLKISQQRNALITDSIKRTLDAMNINNN